MQKKILRINEHVACISLQCACVLYMNTFAKFDLESMN